jgi:hypothetical protein
LVTAHVYLLPGGTRIDGSIVRIVRRGVRSEGRFSDIPEPREKVLRTQIVEMAGTKCLEREWESTVRDRVTHHLARLCDQDSRHKFTVETWLGIPVDQWPAEEKVLRELVESFRVLR